MDSRSFVVVALCVLASLGCGGQSDIVGSWTCESEIVVKDSTFPVKGIDTFSMDGSYRSVARIESARGRTLVSSQTGTWTLTGNKLTETITDVHWDVEGVVAGAEAIKARLMKNRDQIIKEANDNGHYVITWVTKNCFSYVSNKKKYVYYRKQD
ncbi:MAG: hypothetical protein HZC36_03260 [Armatimonadetes bacterium]|nr:hypothetical protein [Armatimonadota bacterium]